MLTKNLRKILYRTYPILIFLFAFGSWSCSNFSEVASLAPPPVADGFNFYWKPELKSSCNGNNKIDRVSTFQSCKVSSSNRDSENLYSENIKNKK